MTDNGFDPKEHVGESVTIEGTAWNAAAGAMVRVDGVSRPIYIRGLDSWSKELERKAVKVTGVLQLREAQVPRGDETDAPEHGLASATFVLDGAEWVPAEDVD